MASIVKGQPRQSFLGWLSYAVGMACFVLSFFALPTIIGSLVLTVIAGLLLWLSIALSRTWACGDCGTNLAGENIKTCPQCRAPLTR